MLEVGTGSGYQTIILALLARRVYSLERIAELARKAIERVRLFQLDNVKIQAFDGTVGWSDVGPFDRILVAAAAPAVPPPLLEQLKVGGKLVIPEGGRSHQQLVVYEKGQRHHRAPGERKGGLRAADRSPRLAKDLIGAEGSAWTHSSSLIREVPGFPSPASTSTTSPPCSNIPAACAPRCRNSPCFSTAR